MPKMSNITTFEVSLGYWDCSLILILSCVKWVLLILVNTFTINCLISSCQYYCVKNKCYIFVLVSVHQTTSCYLSEHASTSSRPDGMLCNGGAASAILNSRPALTGIQLGNDASVLTGSMDTSTSLLSTQNSAMGRLQGINGTAIKSEPSYSGNSEFSFCTDSSFLETQPSIADPPAGSFSSSELTGQPLNDPLPDEPFGFLSHIPRNFSFSDLADHFTQSAGVSR